MIGPVEIVPTHVGVNRLSPGPQRSRRNCPHARGGEPAARALNEFQAALSPRTWG